jgi:hypothetical protein
MALINSLRPRAALHLRPHPRLLTRLQSTASASPSPKISAVPFRLSPSEAAHKLHMNALVASAQPLNLIYAGLLKIFGPGIAPIAREFGLGESLKMGEVKACYWPVWRCDAIAEGKVEVRGSGKEGKGWLGVREGYVPGE